MADLNDSAKQQQLARLREESAILRKELADRTRWHLVIEGDGERFEFDATLERGTFYGNVPFIQFSEKEQQSIIKQAKQEGHETPPFMMVEIPENAAAIVERRQLL